MGTYPRNDIDLHFSPLLHSPDVIRDSFSYVLDYIKPSNWVKSVRSIIVSQAFYSKSANFYFYTYTNYEIPPYGGILDPQFIVIPFLPNIYKYDYGKLLGILDILRIVIAIILLISGFLNFTKTYSVAQALPLEEKPTIFDILIETNFMTDIYTFVLYLACFIIKLVSLSLNFSSSLFFAKTNVNGETISIQNNYELFNIAENFQTQIILECLLIFGDIFKFANIFSLNPRFKLFFNYIVLCFRKTIVYFIVVLFLIISFSIFSNNLWGYYTSDYKDIWISITGTLLFSIGHFNGTAYDNNYMIWNIIYILLFFMVFIYFIMTSFVGLYMECYRLNNLQSGNSYEIRFLANKPDRPKDNKKNKV